MSTTSRKTPGKIRRTPDPDLHPSIQIVRHEVVAEIVEDPHGEHPPLRAAFMAAADYMALHAGDRPEGVPISLEFTYGGGRFTIGHDPHHASDAWKIERALSYLAEDRDPDSALEVLRGGYPSNGR